MKKNLDKLIRAYLLNQLSPEEKQALEQRLAADPAFAAEAAEAATLQAAIQAEGDRLLEAQLLDYANTLKQGATLSVVPGTKSKIRKISPYSRILYAAAILAGILAVALPLLLLNRGGAESPEKIYAANFSIPALPETRSGDAPAEWRRHYTGRDYQAAASRLETLLADPAFTTGRSEAALYLGVSLLAQDKFEAALKAFGQVSADSYDWEAAQWYSALAMLRLKRLDAAKQSLERIARQQTHPNRKQAARILEQL